MEYYITVRKIVPLTLEEKTEIQRQIDGRNSSRNPFDQSFQPYQQGLIPFNPNEYKLQTVLDVVVEEKEFGAIKKSVIEIKN